MKTRLISTAFLTLTILACSNPAERTKQTPPTKIPSSLEMISPKVTPLTTEMKAIYKTLIVLMATSQEAKNCQTMMTEPKQKNDPFSSGDVVSLTAKKEVSGHYCPLHAATSLTSKATVKTHDRTSQVLDLTSEVIAQNEVSMIDEALRTSSQLDSLKTNYTLKGSVIYTKGKKTNEVNDIVYSTILKTSDGDAMTLTLAGQMTENRGDKNLSLAGILKTKDTNLELTIQIKDGIQKTFLNGNAINPDDGLPQFLLPELSAPTLENTNI